MRKIVELGLATLIAGTSWAAEIPGVPDGEEWIPVHEMEGMTVTATRVPTPLSEVPIAIEVYTAEEIEESGASDAGQLLESGVGVEKRDYGYVGSVASISIRGSTANQVLVLVDGRPVNSISLGMADLTEIALDDVKRVEVVRGPVSSLYGANALGGVMNIVTGARSDEPSVKGRAEFGSHGMEIYSGSASSSWKGLGLHLSARRRRTDGERDNSDYRGERLSAKMTYTANERLEAGLAGALETFEVGLPGPVPEESVSPTYGNEGVSSLFDRQKNFKAFLDFSLGAKLREGVDSRIKLYYDRRDMDIYSVYEGFDMGSFKTFKAVESDEYVMSNVGTGIQFDTRPLPGIRLVFGVDAVLSDLDAVQAITNDSTGEVAETRWSPADTTAGLYVETDWRPWGGLGVLGSVRYDWSQAYGVRANPSLGLVYPVDRNARVKLSFGRAFRAPTLNDLYWPESAFAGGNAEVRPEDGFGGELRVEYEPVQSVAVKASVFAREVDDLIEWSPDEAWVWRPANVNEFSSRGLEIELELWPIDDAKVRGHISYLSATERSEETIGYDEYFLPLYGMVERRAAFRPETEGSVRASYRAPFEFDLLLDLDYTGRRVSYWQQVDTTGGLWKPVTREKWLGSRLIASAGLGFHLGPEYLFLRVDNIFDKEYCEQFGYALLDRDYPGSGRTFSYGMKVTLD